MFKMFVREMLISSVRTAVLIEMAVLLFTPLTLSTVDQKRFALKSNGKCANFANLTRLIGNARRETVTVLDWPKLDESAETRFSHVLWFSLSESIPLLISGTGKVALLM